ncbi:MAG: gamma-glutamyl-gamma-aminobutyrate hydrolase family protein [Thermodesulfobacteriota bacterium]
MKRVLVLQHIEHEGLGTIERVLKRRGYYVDYLRLFRGEKVPKTVNGISSLVVLGGSMGVYEEEKYPFIKDEIALIQLAIKMGKPVIGICLGGQLVAKAAGADVYRGRGQEIGWYQIKLTDEGLSDPLLAGLPGEFTVFQWHGDTFDIPDGGKNLASSESFRNQLVKVGRKAYGFQFHLEVTEGMIREWIDINEKELLSMKGDIDPEKILGETPKHIETLNSYGDVVFSRFLDLME